MSKNQKIFFAVILVVLVLAVAAVCLYINREHFIKDGPGMVNDAKTLNKDDILGFADCLGKTPEECGMTNDDYSKDNDYVTLGVEGKFNDAEADGIIHFSKADDKNLFIADDIVLSVYDTEYDSAKEYLISLFGEPSEDSEGNSEQSGGGSLTKCIFLSGGKAYRLTKESNNDYLAIDIYSVKQK